MFFLFTFFFLFLKKSYVGKILTNIDLTGNHKSFIDHHCHTFVQYLEQQSQEEESESGEEIDSTLLSVAAKV